MKPEEIQEAVKLHQELVQLTKAIELTQWGEKTCTFTLHNTRFGKTIQVMNMPIKDETPSSVALREVFSNRRLIIVNRLKELGVDIEEDD